MWSLVAACFYAGLKRPTLRQLWLDVLLSVGSRVSSCAYFSRLGWVLGPLWPASGRTSCQHGTNLAPRVEPQLTKTHANICQLLDTISNPFWGGSWLITDVETEPSWHPNQIIIGPYVQKTDSKRECILASISHGFYSRLGTKLGAKTIINRLSGAAWLGRGV